MAAFARRFLPDERQLDRHYWSNYAPTPAHAAWSGHAFEQVCLLHIDQLRKALGISGVLVDYAAWRGRTAGAQAQIDLVSLAS
jgi:hypothetical protein